MFDVRVRPFSLSRSLILTMAPQGTCTFAGSQALLSASFTLAHGAWPSVGTLYVAPQPARLSAALGCRVVLRLNNSVSIEPAGVGNDLPLGTDVLAGSQAAEPPPRPDALVLVCGHTRWQHDFRLEAVGVEADGSLRPID